MYFEVLDLKTPLKQSFKLMLYARQQFTLFPDQRQWPMVLIFPGGGFSGISERELEHAALPFLAKGYQVGVVIYNLITDGPFYPNAAAVGLTALKYLKEHAEFLHGDPDKIVTVGFSAGGHLVATMNGFGQDAQFLSAQGFTETSLLPRAQILAYPVIDLSLGFPPDSKTIPEITPDSQYWHAQDLVHAKTPPTFIWHTMADELVPVRNSLVYLEALIENKVDFESHIYQQGVHGLAFGDVADSRYTHPEDLTPHVQGWFKLALDWLSELFSSQNTTEI